jgi:8-oxo-dGTP diphosphatase
MYPYHCKNKYQMIKNICDFVELLLRWFITKLTNYLPVKVIRDDKGIPFLYRYHLFAFGDNGPGMCIHHFVKSDPDRGYHDHPWDRGLSFILCGGYDERIVYADSPVIVENSSKLNLPVTSATENSSKLHLPVTSATENSNKLNSELISQPTYTTHKRNRFTFNYLKGRDVFHRVMIDEGKDAWTLFLFQKRSKTWGMISLNGMYKAMSTSVMDQDGGWWNHVIKGLGLHQHLELKGKVIATVDSIILAESKILLIKRGKEPCKDLWALPGGRIESTDKDILFAAKRELKEETNLQDIDLTYVKTIGNSNRDPRGFCLTNIFIAELPTIPTIIKAGDDAVDFEWFDLNNLPEMAFDHKQIINESINQ